MFDLDGFKHINDQYGHHVGDAVLRCVTAMVQENIRVLDVFARLGGDEFALLLPRVGTLQAATVINRLHGILLATFAEHGWQLGVSIGVVSSFGSTNDIDELLQTADKHMYAVKHAGKNQIAYACQP